MSHQGRSDLVNQGNPATASVRLFTRNADLKSVSFSKYKILLKLVSQDEKHENQMVGFLSVDLDITIVLLFPDLIITIIISYVISRKNILKCVKVKNPKPCLAFRPFSFAYLDKLNYVKGIFV